MKTNRQIEKGHSKAIMTSYGLSNFIPDFLGAVLGVVLFKFYEDVIGLNTLLTGAALIIFAIWDAVNDPVVGYFSDRPYKFTKKWGRRFPWILGIFIPMLLFFVLIFYPPVKSPQWVIFLWLVITTCIFDTAESILVVNIFGLFPEKFKSNRERVNTATIGTYFVIAGTVLGALIPPLLITGKEISSYISAAWITVIICVIVYPLILPGLKDDKKTVEKFLKNYKKETRRNIFKLAYSALKQKNLIIYIIFILGYFTLINSLSSSLLYYADYVLNTDSAIVSRFLGIMFGGAIVGVLFWLAYVKKTGNNKNVIICSGLLFAVCAVIFSFLNNYITIYILLAVQGLGVGGLLIMMAPAFSDVIDESILISKQRNEGLYGGFRFLAMNFGRVLSVIILALVHELSGFIEGGGAIQPESAITGIKLHTGLIPGVVMLGSVIIFAIFYDLTPEKVISNKKELEKINY